MSWKIRYCDDVGTFGLLLSSHIGSCFSHIGLVTLSLSGAKGEKIMRQDGPNRQPLSNGMSAIGVLLQLERANGTPLYRQISQRLREAILSGELPEGTRLPPERMLAQDLGVNRTTIMHAYNDLSSAGLTEGHVGRGTVVKHGYFKPEDEYGDQSTPSWLLGLSTNGDALLGPNIQALSELSSMDEP
jgi:2-aminoadipate transaminase